MSWPEKYKKFEVDSGIQEQRMPESECYPKADFSAVSELFIQQTTW